MFFPRFLWLFLASPWAAWGGELPVFHDDGEADLWLRRTSHYYAEMARDVDSRGGYRLGETKDYPQGVMTYRGAQRCIELNPAMKGPARVSVLIFEITNAYQEPKHLDVDARARDGRIGDAIHFGLMHELIEYDGLRLHRRVLAELDKAVGGIPRPMLTWINPKLTTLESYELPYAFEYIDAQAAGGHTAHYRKWFPKQKAQGPAGK